MARMKDCVCHMICCDIYIPDDIFIHFSYLYRNMNTFMSIQHVLYKRLNSCFYCDQYVIKLFYIMFYYDQPFRIYLILIHNS